MKTFRDFLRTGASIAVGEAGMVATSHPAASLAAVEILRGGGNAIDAALAAVAMQCVVDPLMTGIGGDCFALYSQRGAKPIALNGSGRAPRAATLDWFRERGIRSIDDTSAHAVTVPGTVDAWARLSQDFGSMSLLETMGGAIRAAEHGYRITPRVAHDWAKNAGRLSRSPDASRQFLPEGRAPEAGDHMANPALGASLRAIGAHGPKAFYEGAIGEEIVAVLRDLGGLHTQADFADHVSNYVTPITADYSGYRVHECPPNGQGLAALIILRILEGFDLRDPSLGVGGATHLLAEATKAAYRQRDALIGDPDQTPADVEAALNDSSISAMRSGISMSPRFAARGLGRGRAQGHGVRDRRRSRPQRRLADQFDLLRVRQRHLCATSLRPSAEPRRQLQGPRGPSERDRSGQAPNAHDHSRDAFEGRRNRNGVWRHGRPVPGRRPRSFSLADPRSWIDADKGALYGASDHRKDGISIGF